MPSALGYQIDMLLSQVGTNAAGSLVGGHVHFYAAGTTTNKNIWLDVDKATIAANPYTLDANGTAYLFGDGLYRIVIHTAAGVTAYDRDNIRYDSDVLTQTALATGFSIGGGTTPRTLTVDETATLSSKAPKTNTIAGDGTAGRVLRTMLVTIKNATQAGHIKCSTTGVWNGDTNAEQDNIGPDGVLTGVWILGVGINDGLQLAASGITGTPIAVLSATVRFNDTTVAMVCAYDVTNSNIFIRIRNQTTGASLDLPTIVDTGTGGIAIDMTYITSA